MKVLGLCDADERSHLEIFRSELEGRYGRRGGVGFEFVFSIEQARSLLKKGKYDAILIPNSSMEFSYPEMKEFIKYASGNKIPVLILSGNKKYNKRLEKCGARSIEDFSELERLLRSRG